MSREEIKVGGDVDAFCGRCGLDLAHTVVAIHLGKPVKTKCNTCGAFHGYKPPKGATTPFQIPPAPAKRAAKAGDGAPRPRAAKGGWQRQWEEQMAQATATPLVAYRPSGDFVQGTTMQHPRFGAGVVQKVIDPGKVSVLFKDGLRTLIMNRP
jgi:hypothetical protein